ncbi:MAG: hypothetical protein A2V72_00690 [Candidatus Nealsonbacteria bacterium RBG_13_37_56]|uniref:GP-PDE domain-containing protein n=1 Tax=Candidatus Nealsonbacteria bacterium RBG_13_37_56 TaxID=1801661 RepID=A0A1G2DWR8_9BACT|nr:MAG: hypothetical protein A2V72_00690 [Candidatus Nealsonbacteria bacterium RBG_13_37_56]
MFLKIGHRGAKGLEPENTLRSFSKAIDLGVDMIEFDVRLTKDKKVVVIHDDKLDRTTNGKGLVKEKSLKEIKKLYAGKRERIPTLEETLDSVAKRVKVNIELKGEKTAESVSKIIDKYLKNKKWPLGYFFVSSFNYQELEDFKKFQPKVKLGIIAENKETDFLKAAKQLRAFSINLPMELINKKLVKNLHGKGFKIFAWTVNKKSDIIEMKLLEIDGIISDYPNKFL